MEKIVKLNEVFMINLIQSKDNEVLKSIKKLENRKYRDLQDEFVVEGYRFVKEAIIYSSLVKHILIAKSLEQKFIDIIDICVEKEIKISFVEDILLQSTFATETPQGIIAIVKKINNNICYKQDGFYILLDKIQDPGNIGTIIRTAHAAGAIGVLCTKGTVDPYNEKALRATMGSIFHIPVMFDNDLEHLKNLMSNNFKLIVSALDNSNNFYDVDLRQNLILCVGNEGNGVSEELKKIAYKNVKVPMPGGAESLNVSVAASVMIYEIVRQRSV
jgi:TrmH family RNA methyltransferase